MSDAKDVVITYETLFELLRLEKNRSDLQKLSPSFFADVSVYIQEKLKILNEAMPQTSLFASAEREKTRRELENIGRIIKELYDRRERKIIDMALIKSRTNTMIINTSNMLNTEKDMFGEVTKSLGGFRSDSLTALLGRSSGVSDANKRFSERDKTSIAHEIALSETTSSNASEASETASDAQYEKPKVYKEEASNSTQKQTGSVRTVKFLTAIDEIVGPDLNVYGPFAEGTTSDLPIQLADALVSNKQAELVE